MRKTIHLFQSFTSLVDWGIRLLNNWCKTIITWEVSRHHIFTLKVVLPILIFRIIIMEPLLLQRHQPLLLSRPLYLVQNWTACTHLMRRTPGTVRAPQKENQFPLGATAVFLKMVSSSSVRSAGKLRCSADLDCSLCWLLKPNSFLVGLWDGLPFANWSILSSALPSIDPPPLRCQPDKCWWHQEWRWGC